MKLISYTFFFWLVLVGWVDANSTVNTEAQACQIVDKLYQAYPKYKTSDITERVVLFSEVLLNKPYVLFPLGEGATAEYDQAPLYRMDVFDCETYIDTVLALAYASDTNAFKRYINLIRYNKGKVSFIDRNHFASLDWNPNNQRAGFVRDVTATVQDDNQKPVALYAEALINKPGWYQHFSTQIIRVDGATEAEQAEKLKSLKKEGQRLPKEVARIPYIPLTAFFDENDKIKAHMLKQIPQGAIVEIIRPNWEMAKTIGTNLNVSHTGFAIWKDGTLYYRNASSLYGKTTDVPMEDYLRRARKSPTIKGINVQVVLPRVS